MYRDGFSDEVIFKGVRVTDTYGRAFKSEGLECARVLEVQRCMRERSLKAEWL